MVLISFLLTLKEYTFILSTFDILDRYSETRSYHVNHIFIKLVIMHTMQWLKVLYTTIAYDEDGIKTIIRLSHI